MPQASEKNIQRLIQHRYGIIGESQPLQDAIQRLLQAAPTDLTVLITGETGTGKEIFANALHGESLRKKFPFVGVNCAAIPETLLESELFGHEKGAFTGAVEQRKGFFEVANKGTIFLDEIGEIPIGTQVKLLRILESGEFSRLGSSAVHKVDVRVVAATNRELESEVSKGNFRQDLYYRLKSVHIVLPPLRNHVEDIPLLVDFFANRVCTKLAIHFDGISKDSINMLKNLHWAGNLRELRNLIETMVTLEQGAYITPDILNRYIPQALPPHSDYSIPMDSSLVTIPKMDKSKEFELGLIFKTLLEIKSDLNDIKYSIDRTNQRINDIRAERYDYKPINEADNDDDFSFSHNPISIAEMEKKLIISALKKFASNRRQAAASLGISERTLYRKISEFNITDY